MKGVVFTEFLEMVEDTFSPETADEMITSAELETDGAYTSAGTYDHQEMVKMLVELSRLTGLDIGTLLVKYGEHLFTRFVQGFPAFFENVPTSFDLLKTVDNYIHIEVRKLYPDAELPKFEHHQPSDSQLIMTYSSPRGLAQFARGLINGCVAHFDEQVQIEEEDLSGGAGKHVTFTLTRIG